MTHLSHDDDESIHRYELAADVQDLIMRWTPLGCPGPVYWLWQPFTHGPESFIDPDCPNAELWKRTLGLTG